jgi:hypothetical protein
MLGTAKVEKSGDGREWLLTLYNASGTKILTMSYSTMDRAKRMANALLRANWLVTA